MWIYSSLVAKTLTVLLLNLSSLCLGKKSSFEARDLTVLLGDLKSANSEEQKSILKSLTGYESSKDIEETLQSTLLGSDSYRNEESALNEDGKFNETDKNYDSVQWYSTPSRTVGHHFESSQPESNIDSYSDKGDLNPRYSSSEETNHEHHADHYHLDHRTDHSNGNENKNSYSSFHNQGDDARVNEPTSEMFYRKLKLKKVRRNCTRKGKPKKEVEWSNRSEIKIESRSNNGIILPNFESKTLDQSIPALPEKRFHDVSNTLNYPMFPNEPVGFSGEHIHGIPRTQFFQYKNGDGVNHYHLHNHNHVYDANGKLIKLDYGPQYKNLADHFGKLKSLLAPTDGSHSSPYPQINEHFRSSLTVGDSDFKTPPLNDAPQKKGYHYTGPHESYGRKTYKRIPSATNSPAPVSSISTDDHDKSIGMEMYRYGAGQYSTDEFSSHEEKGPYPNEVILAADKPYPNSGEVYESIREKPYSDYQSSHSASGYAGPDSDTSLEQPYSSYSSNPSPGYKYAGDGNKYSEKSQYDNKDRTPYDPQDKAPYEPQDKAPYTPQDKPSYGPLSHSSYIPGPSSAEFHDGYKEPSVDPPRHSDPYPNQLGGTNVPSEPPNSSPEDLTSKENPVPPTVTHSVSYSQDGDIETIDYGPENVHLYKDLKPEPDPLTIPKNARIIEHHIRLHPMLYMQPVLGRGPFNTVNHINPVNHINHINPANHINHINPANQINPISAAGRINPLNPINIPTQFINNVYPIHLPKPPAGAPRFTVPLHKLIQDPLKLPFVPEAPAPVYQRIPAPHFNYFLPAYHGLPFYHRLW